MGLFYMIYPNRLQLAVRETSMGAALVQGSFVARHSSTYPLCALSNGDLNGRFPYSAHR